MKEKDNHYKSIINECGRRLERAEKEIKLLTEMLKLKTEELKEAKEQLEIKILDFYHQAEKEETI